MRSASSRSGDKPHTRRELIRQSGSVLAASALAGVAVPLVHAGEHNMTRLALVGCGGRGTGAVGDALSATGGPVQLYAMADLFEDRLQSSLKTLSTAFKEKVDVTSERKNLTVGVGFTPPPIRANLDGTYSAPQPGITKEV